MIDLILFFLVSGFNRKRKKEKKKKQKGMQAIGLSPFPANTKQLLHYQIKWNGPWLPI